MHSTPTAALLRVALKTIACAAALLALVLCTSAAPATASKKPANPCANRLCTKYKPHTANRWKHNDRDAGGCVAAAWCWGVRAGGLLVAGRELGGVGAGGEDAVLDALRLVDRRGGLLESMVHLVVRVVGLRLDDHEVDERCDRDGAQCADHDCHRAAVEVDHLVPPSWVRWLRWSNYPSAQAPRQCQPGIERVSAR